MSAFHFHHMSILTGSTELEERCEEFYMSNFGMRLAKPSSEDPADDYVFLTDNAGSGNMPLEIIGEEWEEREFAFLKRHGPGIDHIAFEVPDVDAAYQGLKSRGVDFHVPPYDYVGTRIAWCRDPSGVEVELIRTWERAEIEAAPLTSQALPAEFNHVAILTGSRDLAQSTERFYQDLFGMEEILRGDSRRLDMDWAYFAEAGGANPFWLEVIGATNFESDLRFLEDHGPGMDHICFVVKQADRYFERLKEHSVELETEPIEYFGARMFYLRDPAGILVQVLQMPENLS